MKLTCMCVGGGCGVDVDVGVNFSVIYHSATVINHFVLQEHVIIHHVSRVCS